MLSENSMWKGLSDHLKVGKNDQKYFCDNKNNIMFGDINYKN